LEIYVKLLSTERWVANFDTKDCCIIFLSFKLIASVHTFCQVHVLNSKVDVQNSELYDVHRFRKKEKISVDIKLSDFKILVEESVIKQNQLYRKINHLIIL